MKTLSEEIKAIMLNLESKIKQQISETEQFKKNFNEYVQGLENSNQELKGKIKSKQYLYNEITTLDSELTHYKKANEAKLASILNYQTRFEMLTSEHDRYRHKNEAIILSYQNDIKELKKHLKTKSSELEALKQKYHVLSDMYDMLKTRHEKHVEMSAKEIDNLRKKLI